MWIALQKGAQHTLRLTNRQSIWPAPDGSDAELVITTQAVLDQDVILATPRVARLRYVIKGVAATMTLSEQPPAPWQEASAITGRSFEVMITEKGPLVVPFDGEKLPNRFRSWLATVSEDVRCSWAAPPENAVSGMEWSSTPAIPGGLPPGTVTAKVQVKHRVADLSEEVIAIQILYGVKVVQEDDRGTREGEGRGEVLTRLHRQHGLNAAKRQGKMEIVRPHSRNQILRSMMELRVGPPHSS